MPYAGSGGTWDSVKCVPIDPNPGQTGDPCTVQDSGKSGIDSCDIGNMCWGVDPDTLEGTCVAFCTGGSGMPMCADPEALCSITNDGVLILCLPTCDPLLQDCLNGDVCIPYMSEFVCVPDASGEDGQEFDPCEYINACDPGLTCGDPGTALECDPMAGGCCVAFCDVTAMPLECVGMNAECLPWYGMDMPPPGYENVGVCGIPQ
jgi:hypothetical protein